MIMWTSGGGGGDDDHTLTKSNVRSELVEMKSYFIIIELHTCIRFYYYAKIPNYNIVFTLE